MPIFAAISVLTNWFESRKPRVQGLFFHQDPGRAVSQKGHLDSDALMSFLQLGHRIDCRLGFAMGSGTNLELNCYFYVFDYPPETDFVTKTRNVSWLFFVF
jgi:hypothetical protein